MKSEAKLRASRANAKLGGVKTEEGKAVSCLNATKHGVLSTAFDPIDLAEVFEQLASEFGVEPRSRRVLVEHLALTEVRLARCARAEAEIIRSGLNPRVVKNDLDELLNLGTVTVVAEGEPATLCHRNLEQLGLLWERYEPRLIRTYLRLLEVLSAPRVVKD